MKICVVGLGLIGGSMCMALKRGGYQADGYDCSEAAAFFLLTSGTIGAYAEDISRYDVVFVALPPQNTLDYILHANFKENAVVCDVCGVKKFIEDAVYLNRKDIRYVGAHPMAGKEVSGVENAEVSLFDKASMVITHGIYTDEEALTLIKDLTKVMGFARIVECTAEVHDKKIAYTSQLAHVVSNCYVNDSEISACLGFTGGSFQDMTRIAGVDEGVWASLYLANADNLLSKCENLISSLGTFKKALEKAQRAGNISPLTEFLSVGATAYRNGKAEEFTGEGITVTELKGARE